MADAKEDVKTAVKDVLDSRREFTLETPEQGVLHFFIASPSGEDIRKADWQYSKVFNQAIVDGFLTQSQMIGFLKEKGILNDDYSNVLDNTRISLGAELFKLENLMENSEEADREASAMQVARLRDELFQLNQRINGPMANTCENLAEDARTDYLTSRIIQKKDKSRYWETFDDYKNEDNTALAIKSRFEVMLWMQGLESNFLENTPEQSALRHIAQARLERAIAAEEERSKVLIEVTEDDDEEETAPTVATKKVEDLELPDEPKAAIPKKSKGRPKGSKNTSKTPKAPKAPKTPKDE